MSLPIISPRMSALRVVAIHPRSPIRSFITLLAACPLESGATALILARLYMSPPASSNCERPLAQEAYRLLPESILLLHFGVVNSSKGLR